MVKPHILGKMDTELKIEHKKKKPIDIYIQINLKLFHYYNFYELNHTVQITNIYIFDSLNHRSLCYEVASI